MKQWNELTQAEKQEYIQACVAQGIKSLDEIENKYNQYTESMQYNHSRFPATENIDINLYQDDKFQPKQDLHSNFGDIEYTDAKQYDLHYNEPANSYAGGGQKNKKTIPKKVDMQGFLTESNNRNRGLNIAHMNQLQDSLIGRGYNDAQRLAILATAAQETGAKGASARGVGGNGLLGLSKERMPTSLLGNDQKTVGKQIHYLLNDLETTHSDNWLNGGSGGPKIMSGKDGFGQFWSTKDPAHATRVLNKSYIRPRDKQPAWENRVSTMNEMYKHFKENGGILFDGGGNITNNTSELIQPNTSILSPEQEAINRATKVYKNYAEAVDTNMSYNSQDIHNVLRYLKDNVNENILAGVSNCTLTASQWTDPTQPISRAANIVKNPELYNYKKVDASTAVPGNLLITKVPNNNSYHTMMITGFAPKNDTYTFEGKKYQVRKGEPLLSYSSGGNEIKNLKKNIPLGVYNANSDGHTEQNYFRYNYNNSILLPELIVTAPRKHAKGGHLFDIGGNTIDTSKYKLLSTSQVPEEYRTDIIHTSANTTVPWDTEGYSVWVDENNKPINKEQYKLLLHNDVIAKQALKEALDRSAEERQANYLKDIESRIATPQELNTLLSQQGEANNLIDQTIAKKQADDFVGNLGITQWNNPQQFKNASLLIGSNAVMASIGLGTEYVLPLLAPGTTGGSMLGKIAGDTALYEGLNLGSNVLTGNTIGGHIRNGINYATGFNGFDNNTWYGPTANMGYDLLTETPAFMLGSKGVPYLEKGINYIEHNAIPTINKTINTYKLANNLNLNTKLLDGNAILESTDVINKNTPIGNIPEEWWQQEMQKAVVEDNIFRQKELRDLHNQIYSRGNSLVNENGDLLIGYHTVADRYNPDFTEFNPNIEGTESAIYTTNHRGMSQSYLRNQVATEQDALDLADFKYNQKINNLNLNISRAEKRIANEIASAGQSSEEALTSLKHLKEELIETQENKEGIIKDYLDRIKVSETPGRTKEFYIYSPKRNRVVIDAQGNNWNSIRHINPKYQDMTYEQAKQTEYEPYTSTLASIFQKYNLKFKKNQDLKKVVDSLTHYGKNKAKDYRDISGNMTDTWSSKYTEFDNIEQFIRNYVSNTKTFKNLTQEQQQDFMKELLNLEQKFRVSDARNLSYDRLGSTRTIEKDYKGIADNIIIKNVTDYGGINFNNMIPHDVHITYNPAYLKSAEPVTYFKADDPEVLSGQFKEGDPIPLSMRDDFTRNDFRFLWAIPTGTGLGLGFGQKSNSQSLGGHLNKPFVNPFEQQRDMQPFFNLPNQ